MTEFKVGDLVGIHVKSPTWGVTERKAYEVIGVNVEEDTVSGVTIVDDVGKQSSFHVSHIYKIAEKKTEPTDRVTQPSGGLSDHYLADVKKPQRGGNPYQAECDDIIFALNMTFDEGEAFKAIWRTCTARLGYGKKDNTALYNAQKLVHRSNRILQRAELEEGNE